MTSRSDYVSVEVAGERLDVWTEYRVTSDLLTPADAFSLTLEVGAGRGQLAQRAWARVRDLCTPLAQVQLFIGADIHGGSRRRALQLTGRIDEPEIGVSRDGGAVLRIEGRDNAAYLVDSCAPVGLLRELGEDATFIDLARAAVAPWGIQVITDQSAARNVLTGASGLTPEQRLEVEGAVAQGIDRRFVTQRVIREAQRAGRPLDEYVGADASDRARERSSSGMVPSDVERQRVAEASPRAGETVWTFLERHAERLGILMWMGPRGDLVLGSPDYTSPALYRFVRRFTNEPSDPNNFQDGTSKRSGAERYSKVTVYGRSHGADVSRSRISAVAEDATMPFVREKIEHVPSCTTAEQANRAAKRIMREGVAGSDVLELTADDHGQGRYLYAINTVADVVDEYSDADGRRFVVSRTFERSRDRGTSTELKLLPLYALTL